MLVIPSALGDHRPLVLVFLIKILDVLPLTCQCALIPHNVNYTPPAIPCSFDSWELAVCVYIGVLFLLF